jgi:hypothetical protein
MMLMSPWRYNSTSRERWRATGRNPMRLQHLAQCLRFAGGVFDELDAFQPQRVGAFDDFFAVGATTVRAMLFAFILLFPYSMVKSAARSGRRCRRRSRMCAAQKQTLNVRICQQFGRRLLQHQPPGLPWRWRASLGRCAPDYLGVGARRGRRCPVVAHSDAVGR